MIDVQKLYKSYRSDNSVLKVIEDLSFDVAHGHTLALMGPSGSGKTTILNIIAGLDTDYSGTVTVDGNRLGEKSAADLDTYRNATIGFIFQEFNLLSHLNALENVLLTLMFSNKPHHKMRELGIAALDVVGLGQQWNRMPSELSGGQKQRVAIARALINNPRIILADEPTANLDSKTEASVLDIIFDLAREKDATLVLCTHREDIARRAEDRVILSEEVSVALNGDNGGEA